MLFCLLMASVFPITGCSGETPVPVHGTVILPEGVTLGPEDSVHLTFVPTDETMKAGAARTKGPDNSFDASIVGGKGLLPGTYKVAAKIEFYPGSTRDVQLVSYISEINSRYVQKGSKLTYTVTKDPGQSLTVDLKEGKISSK
jgi:hypothetical protein